MRAAGFQQYLNFSTEEHHIYSLPNKDPIFQGEEVALSPITIRVEKETFSHSENFQLNTKLYFSNGVQEKTFDLRPYLEIDGINIDESSFRDRR